MKRMLPCTAAAALIALGTNAHADQSVEAQLQALRAEVAQLKAEQSAEQWMNARREAEITALVHDVMADSTLSTGAASPMTAGYNGKKFILTNEDGSAQLVIGGQVQFRYIYQSADKTSADDEYGFQARRVKLKTSGKVNGFGFNVNLAHSRNGGTVETDSYEINHKLGDGLKIGAGKFKLPFARQELTSSSRQVAVARSLTTEQFTLDKSEGIYLAYAGDSIKATGAFSDGGDAGTSDFNDNGDTKFAFTGRVEGKFAGDWGQSKDAIAWNGEEMAAFLGAAVHYEELDNATDETILAYTIDALVEVANLGLSAAYFGFSNDDAATSADEYDQNGFYVQAVYNFDNHWAPFVRYNWIDTDVDGADDIEAVEFGVNYFFKKHSAKLTADVVYIIDGADGPSQDAINDGPFSDGLGLTNPSGDDEVVGRLQLQLTF